tara:strand:+ start:1404 stop:1793 length:390 start_codon:yes stop_codon:yes gene_type:complete
MIRALIGPIAELAGGWLKGKASAQAASANLKLVEAEAKATIMKSAATSEADWERIMAQGTQNSWKDEFLVILFSIPLVLSFCGEWGRNTVAEGFSALTTMPEWYQYTLGVIVASSFAVRSATKFFGGKK